MNLAANDPAADLLEIQTACESLVERLDRFRSEHGAPCGCRLCTSRSREMSLLLSDLAGLRWAASIGETILASSPFVGCAPDEEEAEADAFVTR